MGGRKGGMATIVIAARARARGHEAGLVRDQVLVPMPDTDLVRHGGTLEKEAERDGRKHWRSMYCVLTEEILGIRRSEGVAMIDWIPLEEIVSVALAGMEPDMLAAASALTKEKIRMISEARTRHHSIWSRVGYGSKKTFLYSRHKSVRVGQKRKTAQA